jgi:hypothetical protein
VFADGLYVGERLAGMVEVAEGIDDGYARPLGETIDSALEEDACDEAIDPAVEVAGDILEGLADADGAFEKTDPPPICFMASSKVSLVRSDGFSNSMPRFLPSRA